MSNQFDSSNISPIIIKKSLQKTIAKIEQAITLIDEDYPQQISDLTIVENLGKNSDILLSYLEDNDFTQDFINQSEFPQPKSRNRPKRFEKIVEEDQPYSLPKNPPSYSFPAKKTPNRFNLLISIALIISILFNIYTFFFDRHVISASNLNNSQEEVLPKSLEEEKQENQNKIDILDSNKENISPQEKIENTQKQKIIEQDSMTQNKDKSLQEDISPEASILPKNNNTRVTTDTDLLTTITNKLEKITDRYEENLINRIEPNYDNNSIIIVFNDNWQEITIAKRQELSQKIFKKVKSIDFYRFQLKDIHGDLLARNAAIGDNLVLTDSYYN